MVDWSASCTDGILTENGRFARYQRCRYAARDTRKELMMNRRTVIVATGALAALAVLPARAQTAAPSDCTATFVFGLLQLDADCLLTPAGSGMTVTPPTPLVSLNQALDAPPVDTTDLRQRSGPRQRAKQRAHDRRKRRHGRHHHGHGGGTTKVTTTTL